ncbi:MAG: hypothetical protein AAAB13_13095 [Pseudomonas sp.]
MAERAGISSATWLLFGRHSKPVAEVLIADPDAPFKGRPLCYQRAVLV